LDHVPDRDGGKRRSRLRRAVRRRGREAVAQRVDGDDMEAARIERAPLADEKIQAVMGAPDGAEDEDGIAGGRIALSMLDPDEAAIRDRFPRLQREVADRGLVMGPRNPLRMTGVMLLGRAAIGGTVGTAHGCTTARTTSLPRIASNPALISSSGRRMPISGSSRSS